MGLVPENPEVAEGEEESLEAPEEAWRYKPRKKHFAHLKRTIAGLRLDVEAAEAGRYWEILPVEARKSEYLWPTPIGTEELCRIDCITLPGSAKLNAGASYIRRCKRTLARRRARLKAYRVEAPIARADQAAERTEALAAKFEEDLAALKEGVRKRASDLTISLGDLHDQVKRVAGLMLSAYEAGETVNGEPVSQRTAADIIGKVMTHTARMGGAAIDATGASEAEASLMEEFNEATRKRLAKEVPGDATH